MTSIDRSRKEVEVRNLRTGEVYREGYDRIILAPGAEPLRPPIPGIDLPNIFSLRNIPDSDRIAGYIWKGREPGPSSSWAPALSAWKWPRTSQGRGAASPLWRCSIRC